MIKLYEIWHLNQEESFENNVKADKNYWYNYKLEDFFK